MRSRTFGFDMWKFRVGAAVKWVLIPVETLEPTPEISQFIIFKGEKND